MFSVGIIGSVTSKALVKLIDFEIPVASGNCAFYLARDGRCYYRNNAGQDTYSRVAGIDHSVAAIPAFG